MALFEDVFNKVSIYDMLFFNIKAVLEYPTLHDLEEKNPTLFKRWKHISKSKHDVDFDVKNKAALENVYLDNAIYHPEFSRIVAITYATLYSENNTLKRFFKKIANEDEYIVISTFMDVLHQLSSEGVKSTPQYFPMLCGHNVINNDLPLLLKRFILHRSKFEVNKQVPLILKMGLNAKPWESTVIDTINVWKFNGNNYESLMLISDFLQLKKSVELDTLSELSKNYWDVVFAENKEKAMEYVSLQSATQTNLVIQLVNELRLL